MLLFRKSCFSFWNIYYIHKYICINIYFHLCFLLFCSFIKKFFKWFILLGILCGSLTWEFMLYFQCLIFPLWTSLKHFIPFKNYSWASLVVQWLRIRLPMQGTWVQALVWEDPTCHGATKPMHHNYWACALEPASHNYWACMPQLLKLTCLEPVLHKRSHRSEKPMHRNEEQPPLTATKAYAQQQRPNAAKNK